MKQLWKTGEWVVRKLHTSISPTPDIAIFYVQMNHFEAYLILSSRVVDSTVLRMDIQFEYFFSDKKENGECNVRNFRRFLFSMSPDSPSATFCGGFI